MRITTSPPFPTSNSGIGGMIERFQRAEADGLPSAWIGNHLNFDAMTVIAMAGGATSSIELGTAVVPTYPRHPMVMAQQALTTSLATGGRFTLGIGLSHKFIVEDWQGMTWAKPARHLRDYLNLLMPLLRGEKVDYAGQEYRSRLNNAPHTQLDVPGAPVPKVLVAALGPAMLKVTGELADGTSLFWCGPGYIESTVVPTITQAAAAAGRPAPRILSGMPIAVTSKEESARASCAKVWAVYGQIYSYKNVIRAEGGAGVADLAIVGDETAVRKHLKRLAEIGVTDYNGAILPVPEDPDSPARTYELLREISRNGL
ncbi:MAG: TIGR03564 family F420-dependent LLM class oxidoreductase [Dehalococcoidia bacterium]